MKNLLPKTSLVAALIGTSLATCAGQTSAPQPAKTPETQPGTTGTHVPRQSVFMVPRTAAEGRDPFFPGSIRVYGTASPVPTIIPTNVQQVTTFDLRLKGFSGPPERRLAIINNYTFEAGEEADVLCGSAKIRIRCLEIRTDSVVVQVGAERKELRLRAGV